MNVKSTAVHRQLTQYQNGAAARFVDALLERGRVAFPLSELTDKTNLSTIAARRQLGRLDSRVRRVAPRQQFFLIVAPEHRALGAPPPSSWLDAYFRWLKRPYYLALQSAASEYSSAAQAIQVTQVMTDRSRRKVQLGRVRVQFFVKKSIVATPTQPVAGAHAPMAASTPEATAIDLISYANRIGGISRAAETIAPFLARLRRTELARALEASTDIPTKQRVGYILESLGGLRLAGTVHAHLPRTLTQVALDNASLLPLSPRVVVSERWAIVVNASVKVRV